MEDQRETDLIDCLRLKLKNFLFKYALYYFQDTSYTGSLNSRRLSYCQKQGLHHLIQSCLNSTIYGPLYKGGFW